MSAVSNPAAPLRLTVLGSSPATPNPNGAGSGYLVSGQNERLLLDCGPGVIGRLRARADLDALDGVVISHLHQDHYIDVLSLRYWVKCGPGQRTRPLSVFLPPGGRERLARLGRAVDANPRFFERVLELHEYEPGTPLAVGALHVTPLPVQHYVPCCALVVATEGRQLS
jgi:ribonuclease BN (tRNA processing enzyme)